MPDETKTKNIIIKTKALTKYSQGTSKTRAILKNISLEIEAGDFVSIMGKSGSGKSTLLYLLSSLDTFEKGEVWLLGEALTTLDETKRASLRRTKIGFVFQDATFLEHLTLLDNILLPCLKDTKDQEALRQKGLNLLQQFNLGKLVEQGMATASGGELQRAGICRALINDPEIIFADEPTGALNSKMSEEVMAQFQKIHQAGRTIVLVTHDPKMAAETERVLFMHDGEIIEDVSLQALDDEARPSYVYEVMRELEI